MIHRQELNYGRQSIFADLNSVEIHRNRISIGGPLFTGPRMSENTLSTIDMRIFMDNAG
jgi:hypothetical protein